MRQDRRSLNKLRTSRIPVRAHSARGLELFRLADRLSVAVVFATFLKRLTFTCFEEKPDGEAAFPATFQFFAPISTAAVAQSAGDTHFDTIMNYLQCDGQHAQARWQGDGWYIIPIDGASISPGYYSVTQYKTGDGSCFNASWIKGQFYHEPAPGNGHTPAHFDQRIVYITTNGDRYAAFRVGDGFRHVFLSHGDF